MGVETGDPRAGGVQAQQTDAAPCTTSCSLTASLLHAPHSRIEGRVGSEETEGTAAVKNDPLCIKSVFHGQLEIQYIKG